MKELLAHLLPIAAPAGILPVVAAIALLMPGWFGRPAQWWIVVESGWRALARRPWLAALVLCLLQLSGVAARWAVAGIPAPHVHDEFSYLLAGETFASGRLTNPTHPMWVHFESPHIIQVPSYTSFYPPGQAIALAAGFLLGNPWIGVVLSTLLMILLIYWAARQWLSPFWALPAGVFGLCLVLGTYWTDTYWGGALNAAAGALVTGAAGVLRRRPAAWHLTLFAAGAVLCAVTRPFEGLVLTMLLSMWLFWRAVRKGPAVLRAYIRRSLPAVVLLAASAGAFCYYDYRVTGQPLTMPYSEGARQYVARRKFLFQKDPPNPVYRHKELADVYIGLRRTDQSPAWRVFGNLITLNGIYLSMPLLPLFLASAALALSGWRTNLRPLILTAAAGVAAILTIPWINPHYYAPFAAALIVATVAPLRLLRAMRTSGARPGWIVVAAAVCLLAARGAVNITKEVAGPNPYSLWGVERETIEQRLASTHKLHLVLVRYDRGHNWHREWVYNHADIDAAPVVWAREMDPAHNARLLDYFKSRQVWLLEADANPPRLSPYPAPPR